jgi:hypothetical protein
LKLGARLGDVEGAAAEQLLECFAHAERQSSDGRDDLETLGLQVVPERRGENSRRRPLLTLTRE